MEPILDFLNEYNIRLNFVMVIIGYFVALPMLWRLRNRANICKKWQLVTICLTFLVICYVGTMIFSNFEGIFTEGSAGGTSLYGVFFVGVPLLLIGAKVLKMNLKGVADLLALYVIPSFFLARCACIISGCFNGNEIFNTGLHWPVREAELIFYAVTLYVLCEKVDKNEIPGQALPVLMVSYGTFRFVNEWFREATIIGPGIHLAHIWSVICVIIGFSVYTELKQHTKKKNLGGKRGNRYV